jgi:hypothetical protein
MFTNLNADLSQEADVSQSVERVHGRCVRAAAADLDGLRHVRT